MAGHSKWANIKHRKGAQDARRSKVFTRIIKEITIAARDGGGVPDSNPPLRLAIQNAKGANMPKDTIERAIRKGTGGEGANLSLVTYEGYGPNGVAVFIEATTDNLNRTVANVRAIFSKHGGSLGTNGSLSYIFEQKGVFKIRKELLQNTDRETWELQLIGGGAEDIEETAEHWVVSTAFEDFGAMRETLDELGIEVESAEMERIAQTFKGLNVQDSKKILQMIERFEEDEDVSHVYHNLELTDELLEDLNNM